MTKDDYKKFTDAWITAHEVLPGGKALSLPAIKACINALSNYPIELLISAIGKHVQTARFAPTPSDIIGLLEQGNQHLGADEAWAIALVSMNEAETVVVTDEIMQARAIALDVYNSGDVLGARMAFRSAYDRIIAHAGPPNWMVSLGFDAEKRSTAVQNAVAMGRLPNDMAAKYLPKPKDGGPIGRWLTGKVIAFPVNDMISYERLKALKQVMSDGKSRLEERERLSREQKRHESELKRASALQAITEKLSQTGTSS